MAERVRMPQRHHALKRVDIKIEKKCIINMKILTFLFAMIVYIGFSGESFGYIYSAGGEEISLVEELPNNQEWDNFDACVLHKQFWILWVPLWNWDARYVLGREGSDQYYEMENEELLARLEEEYGEAASAIPFWDKIGGKLLFPILILLYSLKGKFGSDKSEE